MREKVAELPYLVNVISAVCHDKKYQGMFKKDNRLPLKKWQPVEYDCEINYLLKRSRRVFIMSCVIVSKS